jgi:hypothetical protein
MSQEIIKEIIDLYFSKKKDVKNDYILSLEENINLNVVDVKTGNVNNANFKDFETRLDLISNPNEFVLEENIDKLNPDKIDSKFFWEYAVSKFPNFAISQYPECKNDDDVNKANLNAAIWSGFINKIESKIEENENEKILEIGPGYGSLFYYLTSKYQQTPYYAIDINPLFHYGGLYGCDGKSIPNELGGDFNLIFSFNVFNHLGKEQRSSYYKSVYEKLSNNGNFIFTNYLLTEQNKMFENLWSYKDSKGNYYNTFLSQLTSIDEYEDLADELNDIGFSIKVKLSQNWAIIECTKTSTQKNN